MNQHQLKLGTLAMSRSMASLFTLVGCIVNNLRGTTGHVVGLILYGTIHIFVTYLHFMFVRSFAAECFLLLSRSWIKETVLISSTLAKECYIGIETVHHTMYNWSLWWSAAGPACRDDSGHRRGWLSVPGSAVRMLSVRVVVVVGSGRRLPGGGAEVPWLVVAVAVVVGLGCW